MIESISVPVSYAGNGVTTAFSFPTKFLLEEDLVVTLRTAAGVSTVKTLTTHYTVTGEAEDDGGTVTMLTAPAVGETLLIHQDPDVTQEMDLENDGDLPADTIERGFDKLTLIAQRHKALLARTIKLNDADDAADLVLPLEADRAGKFLAFDDDGLPMASESVADTQAISGFAATLLDDANAATARTTLGIGTEALLRTLSGFGAGGAFIVTGDLAATIVSGATAETAPATDDLVLLHDTSAAAFRKMTLSNLFKNLDTQRNHLYNANFDHWQRGTSVTCANSAVAYGADRWYVQNGLGTDAVITFSRATGASDGAKYAGKVLITTAPTSGSANACWLLQTLENIDSLKLYNKTVSISAKIKAFGNVNQVGITLMYKTTEAKVDTALTAEEVFTVNSAGFTTCAVSLQNVSTLPTTSGVVGIKIRIYGASSGNAYDLNNGFSVEQAMLVAGAAPSDFKTRFDSVGEELAACKRYYEKLAGNIASEVLGAAFSTDTTAAKGLIRYAQKRIAPTIAASSTAGIRYTNASNNFAASALAYTQVGLETAAVDITTVGVASANLPGLIDTTSTAYLTVDAEI